MSLLLSSIAIKLRLRSEDGDEFLLPVASLSQTFALNELPTCTVQLAVGMAASDPNLTNAISEEAGALLREHQYVEVISIIEGDYAPGVPWNDTAQVIFFGKVSAVANVLVRSAASLSVTIRHWMSDLQSGTILTAYANPMDVRNSKLQASTYRAPLDTEIARITGIATFADAMRLDREEFPKDIWSHGIKEFVAELLTKNLVGPLPRDEVDRPDILACADIINTPSSSLLEAWRRIEGPSSSLGTPLSKWAVPLELDPPGDDISPRVLESLRESITHTPIQAYHNADAWSKLIQYFLPTFNLMIVPRVKTAIIAPSNIALREAYCHRIVADDIQQVDTSEVIRRPLAAVGVIGKFQSPTELGRITGINNLSPSVLACYSNDDPANNGRAAFIEPPRYLQRMVTDRGIVSSQMRTQTTSGGVNNPGSDSNSEDMENWEYSVSQVQIMLQRAAKLYYFQQKTQGRTCRIVGKLRFDIAPGSMVEVSAVPEQFNGVVTDSPHIQGIVTRVTSVIDVSRKVAMTTLQLQHVRTKEENDDESFTLEKHPLYAQSFHGAPLLDEYENEPCE